MVTTEGVVKGVEAAKDRELLAALAGRHAARDGAVAQRTRKAVLGSLDLFQEQKASLRKKRAMALAGLLLALLCMAPFAWHVADDLISGEHLCDLTTQLSLLICVLCPAFVAAVLVAGWMRRS